MAKKKEKETKKNVKEQPKPPQGYKQCPNCAKAGRNSWVAGAATRKCPDPACNYEFPIKSKTAKVASNGEPDLEKLAMRFTLKHKQGSIDKALKAVEEYTADSLAKFIADCGGPDKAKAALVALNESMSG